MAPSNKNLLGYAKSISKRVVLSYALDCLILVIFVAGAIAFSLVSPTKAPFSVNDASIAYPFVKDTISILTVGFIAVGAPIVLILIVSLITVPGPATSRVKLRPIQAWGYKFWEIFAGWIGLVLSFSLALFIVQATKNLSGKHRPDFLSRCDPDFNKIREFAAGRFGNFDFDDVLLVTAQICRSNNGGGVGLDEFDDGFRAFPSGHTTISFAGLVYLSLFLAAKFAASIPRIPTENTSTSLSDAIPQDARSTWYHKAAAPPLYVLVFSLIPVGAAVYIAGTRYSDHKHDGFTVLFSALLGTAIAWFAFHWYHSPIRRGAGWAWGPRSRTRAFGIGLGTETYSGPEGIWREGHQAPATPTDLESGGLENPRQVRMQSRDEGHDLELSDFGPGTYIADSSSQRRLRTASSGYHQH